MADKIVLNKALGTYDVVQINNNFDKIATELNEKVLYRQNPVGQANVMRNNLDMNGFQILNLPAPTTDNSAARLKDVANAIAGLAAQTANLVAFAPQNGLTSTNVQGAVEEVYNFAQTLTVDVQRYGAKGDGVTDDTNAIQLALNSIPDNTRLIIKGKFSLTNNLYLVNKTNVVLDFAGAKITSTKGCLLYMQACTRVVVQNIAQCVLTTKNPGTAYNTSYVPPSNFLYFGIMAYLCQEITIRDNKIDLGGNLPVTIEQGSGHLMFGNRITNGGDNSLYVYNVTNSIITKNIVDSNIAGRAICAQRGVGVLIDGNTITNGKGFGASLVGCAASSITNNTIRNFLNDPLVLSSVAGVSVEANESADVSSAELTAADTDLHLFNGAYTRACIVSGNVIHSTGTGVLVGLGSTGNYGVNNVQGNTITSCNDGVLFVGARGPVTVKNNQLRSFQNAAFRFQGKSENVTLANNTVDDVNKANFGYKAIHKDAGVTSMLNLFSDDNWDSSGAPLSTNFGNAELQQSYMEGAWTPVDGSGNGLAFTVGYAYFVKVGRQVTVSARITWPATGSGSPATIGGLPFTVKFGMFNPGATLTDQGAAQTVIAYSNQANAYIYNAATNAQTTNGGMSGKTISFTLTYYV